MTTKELEEWGADFLRFCARFADVFGRKEPRAQATKYLRGLSSSMPRKNSWQVAEAIGDRIPDATQRLLYRSKWRVDGAQARLRQFVAEVFGEDEGIGVVDESGFIKKGKHSVGVVSQTSPQGHRRRSSPRGPVSVLWGGPELLPPSPGRAVMTQDVIERDLGAAMAAPRSR